MLTDKHTAKTTMPSYFVYEGMQTLTVHVQVLITVFMKV